MFERELHREVITILRALDAEKLDACRFFFAGGTRIALDLDEYRESNDIDFMCSDVSGYADLRSIARSQGYPGFFHEEGLRSLGFPREIHADQYGIRFPVECNGNLMKVELIHEGRVELDPGTTPPWSPVTCLSQLDCYVIKILANSDRWPDRQVLSRDLTDLGIMRSRWGPIPDEAWHKAEAAYKTAARLDLRKALAFFLGDESHQRRCFRGLSITDPSGVLEGLSMLLEEV